MPPLEPHEYQPALGWWGHGWRLAAVMAISGLAWFELAQWQWEHDRGWFFTDLGLGLSGLVLVFWRRRHPVTIAVLTALASGVSATAGGPATLALVSLSTRRKWREIIPIAAISLVASALLNKFNPVATDGWVVATTAIVSIIGVTVGWGLYIGSRRELLATLRDRAHAAEAEQSLRVAQAQGAERARIAREMHDVLAHRISMVAMHAGALAYRTDLSVDEIQRTSSIIQENAHRALVDLRVVLGILRDGPDDSAPELPQPSISDLASLIAEARSTGLTIDFTCSIDSASVTEMTGRTAYRVVQEGLTNARKHAPDTDVQVHVSGTASDGLNVIVSNPLRIGSHRLAAPPSGLGLIGLAERVELAGGRLHHEVTAEREFVLEAWLPWQP